MTSVHVQTQDWKVIDSIKMLEYRNEALTRMILGEKNRVAELEKEMVYQLKRCEEVRLEKIKVEEKMAEVEVQLKTHMLTLKSHK